MTTPQPPHGAIAGSVLPIRRAEELISTLQGVLSVRIVPNETGAIEEIHVLTTDAVLPKQTVRNIESALMAQLGLRVNHRKISIATTLDSGKALDLPPAAASAPPPSAAPAPHPAAAASAPQSVPASAAPASGPATGLDRQVSERVSAELPIASAAAASAGRRVLVFEDVEVRRSRVRGVLCRVTLSRGGQEYAGEAEGQDSDRSRIELAARATLSAIMEAMRGASGSSRVLVLEGSTLIEAFDREFIFVSVQTRLGRESVVLTGSCEVRETAETSTVLAVLDATNRWMQLDR
jgi:hypothetical protein